MQVTPVNAVFEGGGVKGISLAGAVRAAEMCGIRFNRLAGTSSGSIVAAMIATGYNGAEMKHIIQSTPFSSFLHRAPIFNTKIIGPAVRLFLRKGLYSGDVLEQWVRELLAAKGVRVFGDLPAGKLRIIASDITNGKLLVLPEDVAAYGLDPNQLSVARAIRMSTSIPYFFDPVILRQPIRIRMRRSKAALKTAKISYVVDGGLLSNFPLWLFQNDVLSGSPIPVIGFQMVGRSEAQPHRIVGPFSMFQAMFDTMMSAHDERYIERHNRMRTIKIPTLGISTTQFNITPEMSENLYQSGLSSGQNFFNCWDPRSGILKVAIKSQAQKNA